MHVRGEARRVEILDFIRTYIAREQISPTLTEIAEGVGLRSASNVRSHLLLMESEGLLTCKNGKVRTVRLTQNAS